MINIGDYIRHIECTTGTGPEGSWVVSAFDDEYILFDGDSSWCKIDWLWNEIDKGQAKLISNKNGIIHYIEKHRFF
jgi:hypothetical protein